MNNAKVKFPKETLVARDGHWFGDTEYARRAKVRARKINRRALKADTRRALTENV